MDSYKNYNGYNEMFLGKTFKVSIPQLVSKKQKDLVVNKTGSIFLNYSNYTVLLSKSRKLPYLSVSNIDGKLFKKVERKDNWRKDSRVDKSFQWGDELYEAPNSLFDRGHMTKREDVQWGETDNDAIQGADSTFYFTNAVPQHASLNQVIWKKLENYILHNEAVANQMKVSVFTGPVFSDNDPEFVSVIEGEKLKLPLLFWKVVYYINSNKELACVAFVMGQKQLLQKDHVVKNKVFSIVKDNQFMDFSDAGTYQVNLSLIEELTELKFDNAVESYQDKRPKELVLKQTDVKPKNKFLATNISIIDEIEGIVL